MVPPKIKTFIWRACIDSLPLHTKLFDRKISNLFSCGFCFEEAEIGTYLFWECSFAQAIWLQAPSWNYFCLPNHVSFIDTLDTAITKLSSADFDTICITCRMIWNCCNKLLFENKLPSSKDLWARADQYRLEFLEVHKKTIQVDLASLPKWHPPSSNSIHKLNLAISQLIIT